MHIHRQCSDNLHRCKFGFSYFFVCATKKYPFSKTNKMNHTAEDFFRKDEMLQIRQEQPNISEENLERELTKRWEECRRCDPEKFKYYVSMLCETVIVSPLCTLRPSPSRHHDGPCTPDERRCENCWSYWCGNCGTGMANWMGGCCSNVEWNRK